MGRTRFPKERATEFLGGPRAPSRKISKGTGTAPSANSGCLRARNCAHRGLPEGSSTASGRVVLSLILALVIIVIFTLGLPPGLELLHILCLLRLVLVLIGLLLLRTQRLPALAAHLGDGRDLRAGRQALVDLLAVAVHVAAVRAAGQLLRLA